MIKYRTGGYGKNLIEAIEVEKETEKCVWLKSVNNSKAHKHYKITEYYRYFDTWEDAHDALLDDAERTTQSLQRQLEQVNVRLSNIKGLKKPE